MGTRSPGKLIVLLLFCFLIISCERREEKRSSEVKLPGNVSEEDAVLVVHGKGFKEKVFLDQKTLLQFSETTFTSYEPWDKKTRTFTGVSIMDILDSLHADPSVRAIEVEAENGYKIPIRIVDLEQFDYILAYEIDGVSLGTEGAEDSKGKLVVAINFEENPDLDMELYKNQLVWQVTGIRVF